MCDGNVIATAVVRAHIVKLPERIRPRMLGAYARNKTSGRNPSTLITTTRVI
jgi:hypothetical protein